MPLLFFAWCGPKTDTTIRLVHRHARQLATIGVIWRVGRGRRRARDPSKGATADEDYLKRVCAVALERLRDPAYVPLVVTQMGSDDGVVRQLSMAAAGRSQNVAFVPELIDRLGDGRSNGRQPTRTFKDGLLTIGQPPTTGDDALEALRALTFEDFGTDPDAWRAWWSRNQQVPWSAHLTRYVTDTIPKIVEAEPWRANGWMARLRNARHASAIPFLTAYMRNPRLDPGALETANGRRVVVGGPPDFVALLSELAGLGSLEARDLLYECLEDDRLVLTECAVHVAAFDPRRATERLAALIQPADQATSLRRYHSPESVAVIRVRAAETLLALGDARAIPVLIEQVDSPNASSAWNANRLLRYYTQEDIALESNASADRRKAAHDAWQRWWDANRATFVVNTRAARIDLECCRM